MRLWARILWWRRPEVAADQARRDAQAEAIAQHARRVASRIETMAEDYRRAQEALGER